MKSKEFFCAQFKMASRRSTKRSKKVDNFRSKSKSRKKPPWDSTISDLLVHKPTKEELQKRHELHQPILRCSNSPMDKVPNKSLGNGEEIFKTPDNKRNIWFLENARKAQPSVLKEIMNSNKKLQETLTYSDKKLSSVPDIFGDDPKKFKGFPNITLAPQRNKHEVVQNLAFTSHPSVGASTLDVLSESVMDNIALNDWSMIQQGKDVETFQRRQSQEKEELSETYSCGESYEKCNTSRVNPGKDEVCDKRNIVNELEDEMERFMLKIDQEPTSFISKASIDDDMKDFATFILKSFVKITEYLSKCESEEQKNKKFKEEILFTVQQQQVFIDTLTDEMIFLQSENEKLKNEIENVKNVSTKAINVDELSIKESSHNSNYTPEISKSMDDGGSLNNEQNYHSVAPIITMPIACGTKAVDVTQALDHSTTPVNVTKTLDHGTTPVDVTKSLDRDTTTVDVNNFSRHFPQSNVKSMTNGIFSNNVEEQDNEIPCRLHQIGANAGNENIHANIFSHWTYEDKGMSWDNQRTCEDKTTFSDKKSTCEDKTTSRDNQRRCEDKTTSRDNQRTCEDKTTSRDNQRTCEDKTTSRDKRRTCGNKEMSRENIITSPLFYNYANPISANKLDTKNTSITVNDKGFQQPCVFIGRNQTNAIGRFDNADKESAQSSQTSPFLPYTDEMSTCQRFHQPKHVSMWHDQRSCTKTTDISRKSLLSNKSGNGWFALSSHVNCK
ncbi:uncharacterized protein LOC124439150 [Xenia sp. Carnegie-2017]|uniref:uncharacterized protein LOC124439150 n=1 Tax=Xenia sp. Carnegie-2017 TaxID=2897299 RepID=UPI001F03EC85|nr:uncharacterized protein LOC124439150 [Xenia sp. Carnegie-2017]